MHIVRSWPAQEAAVPLSLIDETSGALDALKSRVQRPLVEVLPLRAAVFPAHARPRGVQAGVAEARGGGHEGRGGGSVECEALLCVVSCFTCVDVLIMFA